MGRSWSQVGSRTNRGRCGGVDPGGNKTNRARRDETRGCPAKPDTDSDSRKNSRLGGASQPCGLADEWTWQCHHTAPAGSVQRCPNCISPVGRPVHVVASYDAAERFAYVITVYEPDLEHFEADFRTRKKR